MSLQIIDASQSIPSASSGSINRPVPAAPGSIILAEFGLTTVANSKVQLNAVIGYAATLGLPDVVFQIIRDTQPIFTITSSTLAVLEQSNISFNTVDLTPPIGSHAYRITAEVANGLLTGATIVGPVAFSGTVLA
ncbi:hypothetical protein [Paenibacillus hexagrammi]|uniref:Exosporium protein C n=1 Tax=Paenibacillus hexagrammi TaxID=2908839 RepID=A0ABY3SLF8_9BACL|nr:hypothetical protein [Paenibacillus sp. YPD9-1]UJF34889.1 hypothetical protein L0M14_06990 [Paenibacillus sp. YPD9-1]